MLYGAWAPHETWLSGVLPAGAKSGLDAPAGGVHSAVLPYDMLYAQAIDVGTCALPLDQPLRSVHVGGNWGTNYWFVKWWEEKDPPRGALIPREYIEYVKNLHVNWVGISVALHIEDSTDSTVERSYSQDLASATFSDAALRQMIREFREHDLNVYLTLAFEIDEAERHAERPVQRFQLGDPGHPDTGVPPDHQHCPECAPPIQPEFWPWSPSHPDHNLFVGQFWSTYTEQAVHFARIAQEEGVRMYSLGTETDRLFRTRSGGEYFRNDFYQELRSLVDSVRSHYDGSVTYDMNYYAITDPDEFFEPGSKFLWGIVPFVVELRVTDSRSPLRGHHITPRQQPCRQAEPARPGHRPGAAYHGSPGPAGSASPPRPARSPPSVESSDHRASA